MCPLLIIIVMTVITDRGLIKKLYSTELCEINTEI
jgi:hypothetical protein